MLSFRSPFRSVLMTVFIMTSALESHLLHCCRTAKIRMLGLTLYTTLSSPRELLYAPVGTTSVLTDLPLTSMLPMMPLWIRLTRGIDTLFVSPPDDVTPMASAKDIPRSFWIANSVLIYLPFIKVKDA